MFGEFGPHKIGQRDHRIETMNHLHPPGIILQEALDAIGSSFSHYVITYVSLLTRHSYFCYMDMYIRTNFIDSSKFPKSLFCCNDINFSNWLQG